MKTQLYRVKQMAAQKVGRAEKTDLLTEDLNKVEKTVDKVKVACTTTSKKLNACMLSNGPDVEKRKKKLPQLLLGQGMVESSTILGEKSLLGGIMLKAGEAQGAIAGELATCETEIDGHVLAPLHELTEVQIPNISITKKKLSVARLDMDSCKTRWLYAEKVAKTTSGNSVEALAKAELLKSEYEDQSVLFQQLQDQLATEMLTFVAGERTYAQWTVKMLEAQLSYHQAAVGILSECLPNVNQQLEDAMFRPTFGCPLDVHLKIKDREIALVLEECVLFLLACAMDVQGLFRLAGSASKIRKLKASLNIGYADMEDYAYDIHAVTGVLKLYLRELPEPLLTFEMYDEWINASKISNADSKLQKLKELVDSLPKANLDNLRYLICFLSKFAENCEETKMGASNIAIVIGPNLLWSNDDGGVSLMTTGNISNICELLIERCDYFFPKGCEFISHHLSEERLDSINNRFDTKECELMSPEATSGGNIFADMSKKFQRKEGTEEKKISNTGVHGYYNPIASQISTEDTSKDPTSPSPTTPKKVPPPVPANQHHSVPPKEVQKGPPPPVASKEGKPYTAHTRNLSTDLQVSAVESNGSGHTRSISTGGVMEEKTNGVKRSTSSTGTVREGGPQVPRRPAPPIPKYPPTAPPKSKPPDPPKGKPPEPPKAVDASKPTQEVPTEE